MTPETLLRHGSVQRVLRCDEEASDLTFSKKAVETLNRASCHFVRTLAKACAVTAARGGKKRIERETLDQVVAKYIRLDFLVDSLPSEQGISLEQDCPREG